MTANSKENKPSRGIYLLPNLFTTAGLFSGFYAIVAAMNGRFEAAAIAIFIAMIMDGADGRVARMTNTQSDFGAEYDSLSDMIAFGLAPALIMYEWTLSSLGKPGWIAAFIFTAGAALRLARFNTQAKTQDKRYFQGLPTPASAGLIAGLIWLGSGYGDAAREFPLTIFFTSIILGALMVSNVRYNSFKDFDLKGKVPFIAIALIALVFAFISMHPPLILFLIFLIYAISGPVQTLFQLRKHRRERKLHARSKEANSDDKASSQTAENAIDTSDTAPKD